MPPCCSVMTEISVRVLKYKCLRKKEQNMKNIHLLSALSLVVCICFAAALSSCGSEEPETVPEYDASVSTGLSFDGKEFILRDIVHHGDTPLIPRSMENALDDLLLEHYRKTEEAIDCRLTLLVGDISEITANVMSGIRYTDIMNCQFGDIFSYVKAGIAKSYNDIPGIDLHSGKFGGEKILNALTWGYDTYGVIAEYWGIPTPYFNDAFLFNPRLLSMYSQPDPYELWENDEWTFSRFEDIAVAVTDLTSNPDFPVYASGLSGYFYRSAFFANGATVVKRDENGRLHYNLPSQEATQAAEWIKKLDSELKVLDPYKGGSWEYYCDMFSSGQYVFLSEYSWVGLSKDNGRVGLRMEEEFSWMPFPRGPMGNRDVLATYANANFAMFVPVNAETDDIGYVMSALFEPLYEGDNYGWHENFRREVFWNDRSYEMYLKMLDSAVSDDLMYSSSADLTGKLTRIVNGSVSATQVFEEISDKVQSQIDRDYNSYFDMEG